MSPRRNSPHRRGRRRGGGRPAAVDRERERRGLATVETWRGGEWQVQPIPGGAAGKSYRCPGCDQQIRPGTPHLVAWPLADPLGSDRAAERRHWHRGCWQARDRRHPR